MAYHNETCGCADYGNYGQVYNPRAIHNQSCGCEACGNYPTARTVQIADRAAEPKTTMVAVPVELLDEVNKLIVGRSK